jgi:hypothetical protein
MSNYLIQAFNYPIAQATSRAASPTISSTSDIWKIPRIPCGCRNEMRLFIVINPLEELFGDIRVFRLKLFGQRKDFVTALMNQEGEPFQCGAQSFLDDGVIKWHPQDLMNLHILKPFRRTGCTGTSNAARWISLLERFRSQPEA